MLLSLLQSRSFFVCCQYCIWSNEVLNIDKTHFEFTISFYADAGHFDDEPRRYLIKSTTSLTSTLNTPSPSMLMLATLMMRSLEGK